MAYKIEIDKETAEEIVPKETITREKAPEKTSQPLPTLECAYCSSLENVQACTEKYHMTPIMCCESCRRDVVSSDKVLNRKKTYTKKRVCPTCAPLYNLAHKDKLCPFYVQSKESNIICVKNDLYKYDFDLEEDCKRHVVSKCKGNYKKCSMYEELAEGEY